MNRVAQGAMALVIALTPAAGQAAGPGAATPNPVTGVQLVDHRALYKMSLARSTPGSLIQGLAGEMVLEVKSTCEGSTVTQLLKTEFWGSDESPQSGELTASSFESVDGKTFRFTFHNVVE